eukprot:scaffold190160_cov26-Tisochrysis_lutea.AAC.1
MPRPRSIRDGCDTDARHQSYPSGGEGPYNTLHRQIMAGMWASARRPRLEAAVHARRGCSRHEEALPGRTQGRKGESQIKEACGS